MKQYICFDVGGTNVKYALMTEDGSFLSQGAYRTNCLNLEHFVEDMLNIIKPMQQSGNVSGIGVSLPGFINPKTGKAEMAGAISALHGKSLAQILGGELGIQVAIENDANCAALAEKFNGNAMDCDDFICMTIGTGIGGGIFVNGKLVHGKQFKAGEFGLMNTEGYEKGYRNMHSLSSTSSLIHEYKQYKNIPSESLIEGNLIFEEMLLDSGVKEIVDGWFKRLSHGVFNLATVLNPEKILIGGGISAREDLFVYLKKSLEEIPVWASIAVAIEPCKHRNNAGLLGALYTIKDRQFTSKVGL